MQAALLLDVVVCKCMIIL